MGPAASSSLQRPSDEDRNRTIRQLRERASEGRLSLDTFVHRVDRALRAQNRSELDELVHDLPPPGRLTRRMTDSISKLSCFTARLQMAWREPRMSRLVLPASGANTFTVGRAADCDLVLPDPAASRFHAEFRRADDGWLLADLNSTNGTHLNGCRLVAPTPVCTGDQVTFGRITLRVVVP